MTIPAPRKVGDLLFLTSFYNGSVLRRVDSDQLSVVSQSKKVSEKDTDGLHSVMATPLIENGHVYSPCSYGEFRCLKLDSGERLWETFAPTSGKSQRWGHAFVVKHADRAFLFSERGDLIVAKLTPEKYEEISRARLLEPDNCDRAARRMVRPGLCEPKHPRSGRKGRACRLVTSLKRPRRTAGANTQQCQHRRTPKTIPI